MKELQPHLERMLDEKDHLDDRLEKLVAFFETKVFKGLDQEEQGRMKSQAHFMKRYSEVLGDRICAATSHGVRQ